MDDGIIGMLVFLVCIAAMALLAIGPWLFYGPAPMEMDKVESIKIPPDAVPVLMLPPASCGISMSQAQKEMLDYYLNKKNNEYEQSKINDRARLLDAIYSFRDGDSHK